jgi:Cu(I)/Ag(I) efflux system membrane fusion protein
MDLIPAGGSNEGGDEVTMVMTEAAMALANVQTTPVRVEAPTREVQLPGRVAVDERRITTVTAHFDGRIRDLYVDFTGAPIREGQSMATIYSPELVSAQRELLEALKHEARSPSAVESARRKLQLWELSDGEIQRIEESGEVQERVNLTAPVSGVVLERRVSREEHVQEGSILFEVADLSRVWVIFDAYEEDLDWLRTGQSIAFTMRATPGEQREATITYIDPVVNPRTRTARVRAEVSNPGGRLKPNMLVHGSVSGAGGDAKALVPASAVLWTGPRSILYVRVPDADTPQFEAREVTLGHRAGDQYVIEDGVEEGEAVVTHGAFRIDAEMQLADQLAMMNREAGTGVVPAHDPVDDIDHEHDFPRPADLQDATPDAFRAQLTDMLETYLRVHEALVDSDEGAAREAMRALDDAVANLEAADAPAEVRDAWQQDQREIRSHLDHLDHLDGLDYVRSEFNTVSKVLAYSIEQFGVEGPVYRQFCPMAFGEDGAYWLSREEEITNPYLPEDMLRCGEVVEQLSE